MLNKKISAEELVRIRDDYKKYGLIFNNDSLYNPLFDVPPDLQEKPHLFYTWLLSRPEYISFICSEILGVDLLPFQAVIIQELWERKFPMLVGSRGAGKAVSPDELIRIKNGWTKIKDLNIGDSVYGSDGKLCKVLYKTELQENLNFYKITLRDGREIECCEDHMWKVWDKSKNKKKDQSPIYSELKTKDLINNYKISRIGEKSNGIEFRYALPINNAISCDDDNSKLEIHPYVLGVLLGDGCLRGGTISITSCDNEIIEKVDSLLPHGYKIRKIPSSKCQFNITKNNSKIETFKNLCKRIGIDNIKSEYKSIPENYKYRSYEDKLELLKGLMDTDGCSSGNHSVYYTTSKILAQDVLDLVRSLGMACKLSIKKSFIKDKRYLDCYVISIYTDQKIFSLERKLKNLDNNKSKQAKSKYEKVFITNIEYIGKKNGICISVDSPDKTYITKDYIVTHNTFLLAVYTLLRMALLPNRKIVVAGASFRQSKLIYEYCCHIWNNSAMLRDSVSACTGHQGPKGGNDAVYFHIGGSRAIFIPIGTGETIRGLRANDILCDEFKSHNKEIFENVISGFGAVEDSPQDKVAIKLEKEFNDLFGIENFERADDQDISNQIIISGTAYYYFNHFAEYWTKWRNIVLSKGDPNKLETLFPDGVDDAFNWKDYSVIRLPYNFLPRGYMDSANIARSKATLHKSLFDMEFGAVFSKDSDGFFKATLIESCVANPNNGIEKKSGPVIFFPKLSGYPDKKYYMGVDTASQVDNFAIVIIEAHEDHRRIVYCWTTNTKVFKEAKKTKQIEETDFFRYCSRKIRDLMKVFNIETISIDSQGGGRTIYESLHDRNSLKPGEQMLWERTEPGILKDTDSEEGLHIIELVHFAKQEYMSNSNHGLKKDFEDKNCLLPEYNPAILASYANIQSSFAEEMEDCIEDIEQLKRELTQIVVTTTANGRERFDTPEVKLSGSEKTRARKDRYSALLMANMACRIDYHTENDYSARSIEQMANKSMERSDASFIGPAWIVDKYRDLYN